MGIKYANTQALGMELSALQAIKCTAALEALVPHQRISCLIPVRCELYSLQFSCVLGSAIAMKPLPQPHTSRLIISCFLVDDRRLSRGRWDDLCPPGKHIHCPDNARKNEDRECLNDDGSHAVDRHNKKSGL